MTHQKIWAVLLAATTLFLAHCAKSDSASSPQQSLCDQINGAGGLCGDITSNRTVGGAGQTISLYGPVKVKAGVTLTIQAGTTVKADTSTLSYLLVERGGVLNAIGTATSPIVFTSGANVGSRSPSDWGGVVIHGKSATNNTTGVNYATDSEIFTGPYGCGDSGFPCDGSLNNSDSSGTIKYVRIEFAGREITSGKEFNGLFLAGVGKGTTIDHIQCHRGSDDGIEIFGGAVDIEYALLTDNQDDQFDVDEGWRGAARFVVAASPYDGDQAIEYDGIGADPARGTNAVLTNFTMVGSINKTIPGAISVRASGTASIYNSYIAHFHGTNGIIAVANNVVCLAKNESISGSNCSGTVTPDPGFVGANFNQRFESNVIECAFNNADLTGAKTSLDSLFANGNQPNGAAPSTFNANPTDMVAGNRGRFNDSTGTGNNDVTNLACSSPKLNRPPANVLWGATSGISEFRPSSTITVTTYTDPQAAPNGTDYPAPSYIGAFQNTSDNWGTSMAWVAFPVN